MLPTIILALVIAAVFVLIVANGIKNRLRGKSTCACGCSGCGMSEICHSKKVQ